MTLRFTKMHGLGNDFVVVDCRESDPGDWGNLSRRIAHRRTGVGCDQVLLVYPSSVADLRMEIYNADGSRVEMCGNGIRCLALFARDKKLHSGDEMRVETLGGIVIPRFHGELVEVDMGEPVFSGRRIPVDAEGPVREHPLPLQGGAVKVTCLSMGNPHAVVFVDEIESYPVERIGPGVETHPFFPNRTNVEFVQVVSPGKLRTRVWERGAGVTMACGTGASAAAVASHWTGRSDREVEVVLDGGPLSICWDPESSHVFMTGPAATVYEGEYYL